MLYISNLGNNTISFSDGGDVFKVLPNNMVAKSTEKVGTDTAGRIWVENTDNGAGILNCYNPAEITLGGVVYPSSVDFVLAFNAMVSGGSFTTTSTTAAVTTTTTAAITTTTTTV